MHGCRATTLTRYYRLVVLRKLHHDLVVALRLKDVVRSVRLLTSRIHQYLLLNGCLHVLFGALLRGHRKVLSRQFPLLRRLQTLFLLMHKLDYLLNLVLNLELPRHWLRQ